MATEMRRGPGRPRQEFSEEALLDAALRTFAGDGFRAATVDEIARRAGVTKPLLFRRFASKDGLFSWTVEREIGMLTAHLFGAYDQVEDSRLADALHAGAEAIITYATTRPDGFRLLFQVGDVGANAEPAVGAQVRAVLTARMEEIVLRRLERGASGGSALAASVLAAAIVGASEHVARRCLDEPGLDPAAATRLLAAMLTRGLRGLTPADVAEVDTVS